LIKKNIKKVTNVSNFMRKVEFKKLRKKKETYDDIFNIHLHNLIPTLIHGMKREYIFHATRKWRFDFAWPYLKIAVECDGGQWVKGGGRHNTDEDREKLNNAAFDGWFVLRFSGNQINKTPFECLEMVKNVIESVREREAI
jgi:very-short-patch-repair endonuclease